MNAAEEKSTTKTWKNTAEEKHTTITQKNNTEKNEQQKRGILTKKDNNKEG